MNEFYRFIAAAADDEPTSAELLIFSTIGSWDDMGDVSARAFAKDLAALPTSIKRLDIHINSPGGSVFEAQGIYSRLADHRSTKHVYVDGLAASAASIIAMVGHKIFIRANATMMIHSPSGLAMGNADEMRHMATALDSITESMINVYVKKTGLERDDIRDMLKAETWMSSQDAVEKGFADEERGVIKAAAVVGNNKVVIDGIEHDLSRFHNVPAFTATTKGDHMPNKPKVVKPNAAVEDPPDPDNGNGDPTPPTDPPTPPTKPAAAAAPTDPPTPPVVSDYDKGIKAERDRIAALQKLDRPATHAIVQKAIADGKVASDIMGDCMEAMDKAGQQRDRRTDASALNDIPPSNGADDDVSQGFAGKLTAAVKKKLQSRNRSRVVNSRN